MTRPLAIAFIIALLAALYFGTQWQRQRDMLKESDKAIESALNEAHYWQNIADSLEVRASIHIVKADSSKVKADQGATSLKSETKRHEHERASLDTMGDADRKRIVLGTNPH